MLAARAFSLQTVTTLKINYSKFLILSTLHGLQYHHSKLQNTSVWYYEHFTCAVSINSHCLRFPQQQLLICQKVVLFSVIKNTQQYFLKVQAKKLNQVATGGQHAKKRKKLITSSLSQRIRKWTWKYLFGKWGHLQSTPVTGK